LQINIPICKATVCSTQALEFPNMKTHIHFLKITLSSREHHGSLHFFERITIRFHKTIYEKCKWFYVVMPNPLYYWDNDWKARHVFFKSLKNTEQGTKARFTVVEKLNSLLSAGKETGKSRHKWWQKSKRHNIKYNVLYY
jgi:hypothetical protein